MKTKYYKAQRKYWLLFRWQVIDEEGEELLTGSELDCIKIAARLNQAWEMGYAAGRSDEYKQAMRELNKHR